MGFDFKPKNKVAGWYHIGAFSWPFMLEHGLGLVLGVGKGFKAGEFIYIKRPDNLCVEYNDGAKVSAEEAKELAKVARWITRVEEARLRQWGTIPAEERTRMEADNELSRKTCLRNIYDLPWNPEAIKRFTDFADWAEKSGGFRIH